MPDQYEMADWLRRVKAEYREMPGLQLTERQMRRLWSLDGATCAVIIAMLVGTGFLIETPRHAYVLAVSHISRP